MQQPLQSGQASPQLQSHNHTDAAFLGLIRHFCPDVVIENDKYLMHVSCALWDKRGEVLTAMQEHVAEAHTATAVSVYKAYECYCHKQRAKNSSSSSSSF